MEQEAMGLPVLCVAIKLRLHHLLRVALARGFALFCAEVKVFRVAELSLLGAKHFFVDVHWLIHLG